MLKKTIIDQLKKFKDNLEILDEKHSSPPKVACFTRSEEIDPEICSLPTYEELEIFPPKIKNRYSKIVFIEELGLERAVLVQSNKRAFNDFIKIASSLSQILISLKWNSKNSSSNYGEQNSYVRPTSLDWILHIIELVEAGQISTNAFQIRPRVFSSDPEKYRSVINFNSEIVLPKHVKQKIKALQKGNLEKDNAKCKKTEPPFSEGVTFVNRNDPNDKIEVKFSENYQMTIENLYLTSIEAINSHLEKFKNPSRTISPLLDSEKELLDLLHSIHPKRLTISQITQSKSISIAERQIKDLLKPKGRLRNEFGVFNSRSEPKGYGVDFHWWRWEPYKSI